MLGAIRKALGLDATGADPTPRKNSATLSTHCDLLQRFLGQQDEDAYAKAPPPAAARCSPFAPATKDRLPIPEGAPLAHACLVRTTKHAYVVGSPVSYGSYGKVRWAVDSGQRHLVAKVFKSPGAPSKAISKTRTSSDFDIEVETQRCGELGVCGGAHEVFEINGYVYMIMDMLTGSLWQIRKNLARNSDRAMIVRNCMSQLASQLVAFHRRGLIHCDVAPTNCLWDAKGNVRIADLGLMHSLDDAQCVPPVLGIYAFTAPELDRGEAFNDRADVWMLAMTCMTLLSAETETPFDRREPNVALLENFTQWRVQFLRALIDGQGCNSTDTATKWDHFFAPVHNLDPCLTAFMVRHMLDPNPKTRIPMRGVVDFLAALGQSGSVHPAAARYFTMAAQASPKQAQQVAFLDATAGRFQMLMQPLPALHDLGRSVARKYPLGPL